MKKVFETVTTRNPQKSAFDLSHEKKLSCKFGNLYPILLQEVVPGDQFSGMSETLVRMAPMVAPVMHRIDVHIHFFNVPNRIVWDQWEDFITGGDDGTSNPTMPIAALNTSSRGGEGHLADYFGIPTNEAAYIATIGANALPFRAYHEIWNEYYRDENLQTKFDITDNTVQAFYDLRKRDWEKDYFTSALPFAQKGAAVEIPIQSTMSPTYKTAEYGIAQQAGGLPVSTSAADKKLEINSIDTTIENLVDPQTVDNVGITIEDLRNSSRLQEWLEIAARAGSRYKEIIRSMFGTNTGDARLDRPEYIGGGKVPISMSEVLNTTGNVGEAPQGTMAGHGISVGNSATFKCKVKEHGHIMGIMSIMPKTGYQQGLHRMWERKDKFDYYWPKFANLGEQAVTNDEIFHNFADATNNKLTFGYQQRYAEYKYSQNSVHGEFRSSLDFWHLSRIFSSLPALNATFVECDNANQQRIFAVTDPAIDKFYVQIYNQVRARRPMPFFSNPRL